MTQQGYFITLEGIEGVGKSTQIHFVVDYLKDLGRTVTETREPGGTRLGEDIRALLLDNKREPMNSDSELLLMFAARAEHLNKLILPALARGEVVVCDRFTAATYAYQGSGRGIPSSRISQLESFVQGPLRPDLTLLLDAPVRLGLERAGKRGEADRFESEKTNFFEAVRQGYLEQAAAEPGQIKIIDASRDIDEVQQKISELLQECLP